MFERSYVINYTNTDTDTDHITKIWIERARILYIQLPIELLWELGFETGFANADRFSSLPEAEPPFGKDSPKQTPAKPLSGKRKLYKETFFGLPYSSAWRALLRFVGRSAPVFV